MVLEELKRGVLKTFLREDAVQEFKDNVEHAMYMLRDATNNCDLVNVFKSYELLKYYLNAGEKKGIIIHRNNINISSVVIHDVIKTLKEKCGCKDVTL